MVNAILGLFRTAGSEDPLADVKALAAWMERQPSNDNLGVLEAMVHMLEDMGARQPRVTPDRVLAVLELDRLSLPIRGRLLKQCLRSSLSESVRQRLWHACNDLARWIAYTYEYLSDAPQEHFLGQKAKAQLPDVTVRMFYYLGEQAKNSLFRYERWIPGKWKSLHARYEAARKSGFARVPLAFAPGNPALQHTSAEQEYLQILLMWRLNTGNLTAAQIAMAALWLRAWLPTLALSDPPLEGAGFWLDLGLGDGLLAHKPRSARGALLYLDVARLQTEIGNGLVELHAQRLRDGTPAIQAEAAERLALLQRLEQLWGPAAKPTERRGGRVKTDRPVNIAAGLMEITAVLNGADSERRAMYRRFRNGEPAEAASGRVPPTPARPAPDVFEYEQGNASGWRMHDHSEASCKLVSASPAAAQQKLGGLLGIQDQSDTRWKIGIIRRLKRFSGGQTEFGVEIIAQHSLLIAPKPIASRDTGYSVDGIDVSAERKGFDALYLPPMQTPGRAPLRSVVVPALEYAERRRFFMTFDSNACTIEFTTALERTKDWVWSGIDIVTLAR